MKKIIMIISFCVLLSLNIICVSAEENYMLNATYDYDMIYTNGWYGDEHVDCTDGNLVSVKDGQLVLTVASNSSDAKAQYQIRNVGVDQYSGSGGFIAGGTAVIEFDMTMSDITQQSFFSDSLIALYSSSSAKAVCTIPYKEQQLILDGDVKYQVIPDTKMRIKLLVNNNLKSVSMYIDDNYIGTKSMSEGAFDRIQFIVNSNSNGYTANGGKVIIDNLRTYRLDELIIVQTSNQLTSEDDKYAENDVANGEIIKITFNKNELSLPDNAIEVVDTNDNSVVSFTMQINEQNSSELDIICNDLQSNNKYKLIVKNTITDINGSSLNADKEYYFYSATESIGEIVLDSVKFLDLEGNEVSKQNADKISLTFSSSNDEIQFGIVMTQVYSNGSEKNTILDKTYGMVNIDGSGSETITLSLPEKLTNGESIKIFVWDAVPGLQLSSTYIY